MFLVNIWSQPGGMYPNETIMDYVEIEKLKYSSNLFTITNQKIVLFGQNELIYKKEERT